MQLWNWRSWECPSNFVQSVIAVSLTFKFDPSSKFITILDESIIKLHQHAFYIHHPTHAHLQHNNSLICQDSQLQWQIWSWILAELYVICICKIPIQFVASVIMWFSWHFLNNLRRGVRSAIQIPYDHTLSTLSQGLKRKCNLEMNCGRDLAWHS